jgi:hypothetical protein
MTLGHFAGPWSTVFLSHSAQILGRLPSIAAQVCHWAVTFDGSPNLPWSSLLGAVRRRARWLESTMDQPPWSSPPWSRMPWDHHGADQLGVDRHGAGCLEVTLELAALELAARGLQSQYAWSINWWIFLRASRRIFKWIPPWHSRGYTDAEFCEFSLEHIAKVISGLALEGYTIHIFS